MPNPDDKLTDIPKIIPQRDDVAPYGRGGSASDARKPARAANTVADPGNGAAVSGLLRFCAVTGFLVALLAAAGAGFVYLQSVQMNSALQQANLRIADLEGRLSSTDDSVNQSSASMQVKIKELASEVDKLWGSAWKKNGARIDELAARQQKADDAARRQLATLGANQTRLEQKVAAAADLAITLETMKEQISGQQSAISRLSSTSNSLSNTQRAQEARLKETEQWVESNIEFRKQATQRLTRLENPVTALPKE